MQESASLILEFSFFIVFALLGTVLSIRFRQPYVVGLLLFGMLAGPNMLSLVTDQNIILTFSEIGAILLLFAVGIEFSVLRIIKSGFRAVFITLFKMGILFFFGYEIALYFGFDLTTALFIGAMISITSTAILFKILWEKGLTKNRLVPLLVSMLIVEDVIAVIALTFFSSLGGASATYDDKFQSILISLGLIGAFYILVRKPVANAILRLTSTLNQEVMIFVSFSLCLAMSMLASFLNLSPVIGAFLAGSIVASLPNSRSIERSIKPLLLMFAALFFLSLGMRIDPSAVVANLPLSLALVGTFATVCFLSVLVLLYTTGSSGKNALFGASSMVVLGEFSLLIASIYKGPQSSLLLAVGSFGVITSALISSTLLNRREAIYEFGLRTLPSSLKRAGQSLSIYISGLVRDFSPSGSFWKLSMVCWKCMLPKIGWMAVVAIAVVLLRLLVGFLSLSPDLAAQLRGAILILGLLVISYFILEILRELRKVLDALARTIARHKKNAKSESVILRDLAAAAVFILLSLNVPDLVAAFKLPAPFEWIDEIFFLLSLVFLWDVVRHALKLRGKREK